MSADKISLRLFLLSLLATLLLVMTACDDVVGPGEPGEPITELPRELTVVETEVIERSNDFGLALLREVVDRDTRANVVLSPLSASMALGIAFRVDDGIFDYFEEKGRDVEGSSSMQHKALPVPAVYVIDDDGMVTYAFVEPDYKVRLSADDLLDAASEVAD